MVRYNEESFYVFIKLIDYVILHESKDNTRIRSMLSVINKNLNM